LSPWRPRLKASDVAEKRLELKEQTETDRLPRVKEKRNYKRFKLIPFLAIVGCIGMFLFECIFIFELYDRAVERSASPASAPALESPSIISEPVHREPVEPVKIENAPVAIPAPVVPAETSPVEVETVPAAATVPVG
jgi:hypothetical protein